jgi:mono/diheme cytochrome c family protein
MSMLRILASVVGLGAALAGAAVAAQDDRAPHLGKPISARALSNWDRTIFPDGRGLPEGRGTAKEGRALYAEKCASCHGDRGQGGTAEDVVGEPHPPTPDNPSKAIGSYWPFATTIFDFVSRSMPPAAPGSLTSNETYAITAYLLSANGIISETDEMSAATLPKVQMPNRNGFVWIDVKNK